MSGRALMVVMALLLSLVAGIAIAVGSAAPNALAPWPITEEHSGAALTAIPLGASATFSPSLTPTRAPTGVFSPRSTRTVKLRVTPSSTSTPTPATVALTPTEGAASAAMTMVAPASCMMFDFEAMPAYTKMIYTGPGAAELVWRVRNRATSAECMWGGRGEETDSLYAREVTGQVSETQKAKLTWVGENEYDLALAAPPGLQPQTLVWRLVVPATGQVGGAELVVPREVVTRTPTPSPRRTPSRRRTPTPTIIPTPIPTATAAPTPCPTEVYECRCQKRCQTDSITGRTVCKRVCDHCIRSVCP